MPNRVTYTFSLNDQYTRDARRVTKSTRAFRASMRGLGKTALTTGRVVKRAFVGMKAAAVGLQSSMAPLLAGLAGVAGVLKFFSLGLGFQDSIADLSSITKSTGADLEFLKEESLRLGKVTKTASADVATAFKLVASAKSELLQDPKALSQITEQVLLLKNATGIELSDAANIALESMNQFGLGASEASRVVNVLAAASQVGAAEVSDIGPAVINSGTAAKLAGVGFEELNAGIQVLAKNGLKGQRAGTGLQGAILKLDAALPGGIKGAGGLAAAFQKLADANLDNAQLTKLFGLESIKAGSILKDNVPLIKDWTRQITGTNVAQEQANVRLSTMSARLRGLGVTIANAVIRTFERLSPVFEEVIGDMETFFDSITADDVKAFADGLRPVVQLMIDLASAAANVAEFMAPIGRLISASAAGLSDLGTLATGGTLTAANSASFKNAVRLEKQQTDINVNVNAPAGAVESVKSATTGKASGLNTGVNLQETG